MATPAVRLHVGTTLRPTETPLPAIGDPVVVDGTKYRIRTLQGSSFTARTSFGNDWTSGYVADLVWDRVPAVWRIDITESEQRLLDGNR